MRLMLLTGFVLMLVACGGGDGVRVVPTPVAGAAPLLAAGTLALAPTADSAVPPALDLSGYGVQDDPAVYELTTPAGEPFVFDVLCRREGNRDPVRVSVAHGLDGGAAPGPGASLADAGFLVSAAGRSPRGPWLDAWGDGFARITVRGEIDRDQVLLAQASDGRRPRTVAVQLRIGEPSAINVAAQVGGDHPGVLEEREIYSSNSWTFGLPTVAVSGDRTSVVCYEGDRADPFRYARYEMRLQVDHATGDVTGGGAEEASPDSGNWRDHEIAALYNVLARVHGGTEAVTLALSFDRGATFDQTERWASGGGDFWRPRLVQVAMALDYTLAVLYWRAEPDGRTALVLVEGRPLLSDPDGSPLSYTFDPEVVLVEAQGDVTPALLGARYSEGGDLAVGYAYTAWESLPDAAWRSTTRSGCVVKPWGEAPRDTLIEEDVTVGRDPSVALLGSGETMRVFCAWEGRDGVRLASSDDAGVSFSAPLAIADPSSHMPTVFAREVETRTVVDVLYLAQAPEGLELHVAHWDDWGASPVQTWRLTRAILESGDLLPPDRPVPGAPPGALPPDFGFRITQVAWFGYDAMQDGDEIVVVVDEETFDGATIFFDDGPVFGPMPAPGVPNDAGGEFVPAEPPPLAPGMTEPVPPPDPDHMHQLKLIRFR